MIRRVIICLLTAYLLSTVPLAEAQQTGKVYRIGYLGAAGGRGQRFLKEGLVELG